MTASVSLTVNHIQQWCGVGKTKSYEIYGEVVIFCNEGKDYHPTVWEFCDFKKWKHEYIYFNLYFTKEDMMKLFVEKREAAAKATFETKYFGTLEIPFP